MKFIIDQSLDDYIQAAQANVQNLLSDDTRLISTLRGFHQFFPELLSEEVELSPEQSFLLMNSYMLYTCGIQTALSGHAAACFPIFRVSLESACYAYLMGEDNGLAEVWSNRNNSPEGRKRCRQRFTSAVKDAAQLIQASGLAEVGTDKWLIECYEAAIDYGAHPNPNSIIDHIGEPEEQGDHWLFTLTGLYSSRSSQAQALVMAALDYGLAVAVVFTHCVKVHNENALVKLVELNSAKNDLHDCMTGDATK